MAVAPPVSATSFVEGIIKPKRVRKGVLKPDNSHKGLITVEKGLISLITLDKDSINDAIQPTIATIASKIEVVIPKTVKTKKPPSKTGSKIDIAAENIPSNLNIEPLLKATTPINGIKEINVLENSITNIILDSTMGIQLDNPDDALIKVSKRTAGRPLGSLDKMKRHPLGDKPLGRPPGSKDTAPRKRRIPT
jgi:hypothetical protein